jgi:protein-disulfide isomerase
VSSWSAQHRRRDDPRATRLAIEAAKRQASARRRRRNTVVAAVAAALVVLGVGIIGTRGGGTAAGARAVTGAAFSRELFAGIPQHGAILGNPNAPVRVIEYADLQCPFCGEYATGALPQLVTDYVRSGEVSMDFRTLSFIGPDSVRAGRVAAAAAEQNKLWNFVDLEYLNQGVENTGYATDAYLHRLLSAVPGLHVAVAEQAVRQPATAAALAAATSSADAAGINSTPSFLIGPVNGALRLFVPSSLMAAPFAAEFNRLLTKNG